MPKPLVSVIVAARNAVQTLDRALASVARQTMGDWECIICDDHSHDQTLQVAERWVRRDPRFRIICCTNRGVVPARNAAIRSACGSAYAIFDADDVMHPARLRIQTKQLARQGGGAVGSHVRYIPRRLVGDGLQRYERWLNSQSLRTLVTERFVEMPLAHPSMLIDAQLFSDVGGYQDRGWPEDYDLYLRIAAAGAPLAVIPHRLHAWRVSQASSSRTDPRYDIKAFARCRAWALATTWLRTRAGSNARRYMLCGYGGTGKQLARNLADLDWRPERILELAPGRIGQNIFGAPVSHAVHWMEQHAKLKPNNPQLIVSVAGRTARQEIRALLERTAWREGLDWVFAA